MRYLRAQTCSGTSTKSPGKCLCAGGYDGVALGLRRPADEQEGGTSTCRSTAAAFTEVEDATVNAMQNQPGRLPQRHSGNRVGPGLRREKSSTHASLMTVKVLGVDAGGAQVRWFSVRTCTTTRSRPDTSPGAPGDVFSTSERIDFSLGDMWVVMTDMPRQLPRALAGLSGKRQAQSISGCGRYLRSEHL
ncbi:Uncharacterised protein [Klebsiella pneumoniae]|nr:Uncharacterised protein [Klebsiella pneumoniae]